MLHFSAWLSQTSISLTIQTHLWVIPLIQCLHIIAFCVASMSVFMIAARVIGIGGTYQTLHETLKRYVPFLSTSLSAALVTGGCLIIGEPARELMSFSFWAKMSLLALVTITTYLFQFVIAGNRDLWEGAAANLWSVKIGAVLATLIWLAVIVLGRLIGYDSIWGSLSHLPRG